jgi:hypothetical protein
VHHRLPEGNDGLCQSDAPYGSELWWQGNALPEVRSTIGRSEDPQKQANGEAKAITGHSGLRAKAGSLLMPETASQLCLDLSLIARCTVRFLAVASSPLPSAQVARKFAPQVLSSTFRRDCFFLFDHTSHSAYEDYGGVPIFQVSHPPLWLPLPSVLAYPRRWDAPKK